MSPETREDDRSPAGKAGDAGPSSIGAAAPRSRRVLLLLILFAALAIRLVALWAARDATPILDEKLYLARAHALLDGDGFVGSYQSWARHDELRRVVDLPQYPGSYQPPLYIAWMAGILWITGESVLAIKLAQVLISTVTVWLVYRIGRSWFDERRALLAAAICAVYPNLIAFSHYLWTETLFAFLLLAVLGLLTNKRRFPSLFASAACGVLLGLAALTRSGIVYFIPLLLAWFLDTNRSKMRTAMGRAAMVLLMTAVVILPWSVRNYRLHGGFVLVDSNGPYNLWRGNTPRTYGPKQRTFRPGYPPPFQSIPLHPVAQTNARMLVNLVKEELNIENPTDLQIMAQAKKIAFDYIREDPMAFLGRARYKVIDMWNPTSFLLRHFHFRAYGDVSLTAVSLLSWLAVISYMLVMILGVAGWFSWWRDPRAWLTLLLILFFTALHAIVFGLTRFRLPLMPLIIMCSAQGAFILVGACGQLYRFAFRRRQSRPVVAQ